MHAARLLVWCVWARAHVRMHTAGYNVQPARFCIKLDACSCNPQILSLMETAAGQLPNGTCDQMPQEPHALICTAIVIDVLPSQQSSLAM